MTEIAWKTDEVSWIMETKILAAPVAEWLRTLIFSALNHPPCKTSQVLLAGGQVIFLGDFPFSPHLQIDSAQNEWNSLEGPWNPNQKKKILIVQVYFTIKSLFQWQ